MQVDDRILDIAEHVNACRVELSETQRAQYFKNQIGIPPKLATLAAQLQTKQYRVISVADISELVETAYADLDRIKWRYEQWRDAHDNPRELTNRSTYRPEEDEWAPWRMPEPTFEPKIDSRPGSPLLGKQVSNDRGTRLFRPSWFVAPWFRFVRLWWESKFDDDTQFAFGGRKDAIAGEERNAHLWTGPKGGWRPVLNQAQKLAFLTLPPEVEPTLADVFAVFKAQKNRVKDSKGNEREIWRPAPIDQNWSINR